jgi:hypothetical protein
MNEEDFMKIYNVIEGLQTVITDLESIKYKQKISRLNASCVSCKTIITEIKGHDHSNPLSSGDAVICPTCGYIQVVEIQLKEPTESDIEDIAADKRMGFVSSKEAPK